MSSGRAVLVAVFASALLLFGAAPVWAHTQLISTAPAEGAVLPEAPREVVLTFSEPLNPDLSKIAVVASDGHSLVSGPAVVEGATVRRPVLAAAGVYRVAYRVVSSDGHPVQGELTFSVNAPGAGASPQAPPPTGGGVPDGGQTESGRPMWVWAGGLGGLVVLAVAGYLVIAARRRRAEDGDAAH